ncbi:amidohydrolase family protein [Actinomycetota bacterium]
MKEEKTKENKNDNKTGSEVFKIIDSHFHIGKYVSSTFSRLHEGSDLKAVKDLNYIKIIFIHTGFFFDLDFGLKETIKFVKKYNDFAYAMLVYNPHYIEKSVNMIKEHYGKNNIVGIKMHPEDHRCFITDDRYEPLWKIAEAKGIPIMSHTWNPDVPSKYQKYADALLFENIVKKHPGLKVILGHAGAKDYYYCEVIKMLKRNRKKNIFVDLAGDVLYKGMLEEFVGQTGSDNILFGTDHPWMDPLLNYIYVRDSKIGVKDKENIFYENSKKLFNL